MKWYETEFSYDYFIPENPALLSCRVMPSSNNKGMFEAQTWGSLTHNAGFIGLFETVELAKEAVETKVRLSLAIIIKELELE